MDLDSSAPGDLVWYRNNIEVMRKTGMDNIWTAILYKENNNDVYDCQLEHFTLPRYKWSQVSCENKIVMNVQYVPMVNISDMISCVIEGRSYKLECRADGNPVPRVFWVTPRNEHISGQTLVLHDIARDDNGEYICNATNIFWDESFASDTETVLIENIEYAPDVEVSVSGNAHEDGRVCEGDSFVMLCNVTDAYPEEDIVTWTTYQGDILTTDTVTFDNVTRDKHGEYMCSAYNRLCDQTQGNGSTIILVDIQYSPSVTVTDVTGFNVVEGNIYYALCDVDSNPDSAITWLHPDGTKTNGYQLEITNTNRNDAAGCTDREDMMKEIDLLKNISCHPNIISLLGCCTNRDLIYMITEYMESGDLLNYLRYQHQPPDSNYVNLHEGKTCTLMQRDLFAFALQISNAMAYLEEKEDLLPIRWMAIESIFDGVYTTKTDVWSYGVLLWEIFTFGTVPYTNMTVPEVIESVKSGYRMSRPDKCVPELYSVMEKCWASDPMQRPSFQSLAKHLQTTSDNYKPNVS
ncbi:uncharacterized protein LOC144348210 [Saccoglossus kowalevskii]